MAVQGEHPDLIFRAFPWFHGHSGTVATPFVRQIKETYVPSEDIPDYWEGTRECNTGTEGLMFRSCTSSNRSNSGIKEGRSTVRAGYLIKWKAKKSAEFRLVSMNPLFNKDGVVQDCLGSLVLMTSDNKEFKVGTGFTLKQRVDLWYDLKTKDTIGQFPTGQLVEVEFMDYYPSGIPRQPVFKGFRDA
jgi:ATP-dependent DNA ligase